MKKLIAACLLALSAQISIADSYLWWQFPGLETGGNSVSWVEGSNPDYANARVGVMSDATGKNVAYLNLYNISKTSEGSSVDLTLAKDLGVTLSAALGDYYKGGYSYYIELVNDSNVFVGRSEDILSYAAAAAYVNSSITTSDDVTAWMPTSFTTEQIPEPTSGLLVLLGLAGLALKRKQ
jgi:hypothetical protein